MKGEKRIDVSLTWMFLSPFFPFALKINGKKNALGWGFKKQNLVLWPVCTPLPNSQPGAGLKGPLLGPVQLGCVMGLRPLFIKASQKRGELLFTPSPHSLTSSSVAGLVHFLFLFCKIFHTVLSRASNQSFTQLRAHCKLGHRYEKRPWLCADTTQHGASGRRMKARGDAVHCGQWPLGSLRSQRGETLI